MAADLVALRKAADLLDDWGKGVGHTAMLNSTDPYADTGIKLYASVLAALSARARFEAADLRCKANFAEASPENEGGDT